MMDKVLRLDNVSDYNNRVGQETLHPLVSIINLSKSKPLLNERMNFGFYTIYLKQIKCKDLRYGCNYYDYQEGTLVFVATGQVIGIENNSEYFQPQSHALTFHPDLIRGTSLNRHMNDYTFFSYEVHEALHLSESERKIVLECFSKIEFEL